MSNEQIKQEAEKLHEMSGWEIPVESAIEFLSSFAARVRNEAIELCAKKCDSRRYALTNLTDKLEAGKCADSIRSLKSQETTDGK